jgi:Fe-S cluster biogenesis protein NfuA
VIGIHPERVAGDPQTVRWVIPGGTLPTGVVLDAPGRLGEMVADGTLSDGLVEHGAVWLRLASGLSWSHRGSDVQKALREALADPSGWTIEPGPGEVLERVTADLLAGSVGDFVRSHGGSVAAHRDGGQVVVQLGGACEHCPAAEHTLALRLLDAVRRRCPDVIETGRGRGEVRMSLPG